MKNIWGDFWKSKGKDMEWTPEDILGSKSSNYLAKLILRNLNKKNFQGVKMLELGSGMGITSLYYGSEGAKVTLLDMSPEVKELARRFWGNYAKHKFVCADLFKYKTKERYDLVTSFGLCEHFVGNKRYGVLEKHTDLLKDKGVAVISVPYKYGIFYRLAKFLAECLGFWSFGLEVPFSKRELIDFAQKNNLSYQIIMGGFYSSIYDLIIRKPLKIFNIHTKRRFDNTPSLFDRILGSGLLIILRKG